MSLIKVARCDEVPEERGLVALVKGRYIAIFRIGKLYHAIDNTCLHAGASLGDGDFTGTRIICPWHGWCYDVTTGACLTDPKRKLKTYPVRVENEEIFVEA
ncbi:MAG: Rieske (2Fe-2S) protein [Candidatus Binataceae bacterium]